ncbi:MAG: hypothetical protein ACLP1X_34625 [Polyangiaceae bacterium]|jgi:hypothetical protein
MKLVLPGLAALAVAASLSTSCGVSVGGSALSASDGGNHDGTITCGGSGELCCNGSACNAGLICSSGTCAALAPEDATVESAGEDEAGNTASGLDAGDDTLSSPEMGQDSSGMADAADDTSGTGNADTGTEGGSTEGGPIDGSMIEDASDAGRMDASEAGGGDAGGEGGSPVCLVPEGGAPCSPGKVSCGSTTCDTATDYCCAGTNGAGTCEPLNGGTCASGVKVECDETADCASGDVCCQQDAYGPHSATCEASCPTGYFQVCRSNAECTPQTCIVQLCSPSAGTPQTVTLEGCPYSDLGGAPGPLPLCTAK